LNGQTGGKRHKFISTERISKSSCETNSSVNKKSAPFKVERSTTRKRTMQHLKKISQSKYSPTRNYDYLHNRQDALEEQERLLRAAASRVKTKEERLKHMRKLRSEPFKDLSKLPNYHWKLSNPYACLGLPPQSSFGLVKKHYRKLCLLYHPDKACFADAPSRFQGVKEAYEMISKEQEKLTVHR